VDAVVVVAGDVDGNYNSVVVVVAGVVVVGVVAVTSN